MISMVWRRSAFSGLFALVAALALSMARCASADVAPDPMGGGVNIEVPGHAQTDIALIQNTVRMKVWPNRCETRAFFRLRNTGKAVRLDVGFPLNYRGEAEDFGLSIDGIPASYRDETIEGRTPLKQKYTRYWKMWPMNFAAGGTHLVEVRYSNTLPEGYSTALHNVVSYPAFRSWKETGIDFDLADYGYPQSARLHDWTAVKSVRYRLITGSYWNGPIERCRVEIDIENIATDSIIDIFPRAKSFNSKKVVWDWGGVEPQSDVGLVFVGGFSPRATIIPWVEKVALANPRNASLRETLALLKQDFPNEAMALQRQKSFVMAP